MLDRFPDSSYSTDAFTLTLLTGSSRLRRKRSAGSVVNHRPAGWGKSAGIFGWSLLRTVRKEARGVPGVHAGMATLGSRLGAGAGPLDARGGRPGSDEFGAVQYGKSATTSRADESKELMRQAREAYDAQDYGKAQELADKARALKGESAFYDEDADCAGHEKAGQQTGVEGSKNPRQHGQVGPGRGESRQSPGLGHAGQGSFRRHPLGAFRRYTRTPF